ncbi:MAG: hypothetical protein GY765_05020 [bacterium]|nr:hypothetical protein [bacterium]
MNHLEDEDIAGMIEGKTDPKEREHFLRHLSECKKCRDIYVETLKFVEEEGDGQRNIATLPIYRKKSAQLALAASLLLLVILPFLLKELSRRKIEKAKVMYLETALKGGGLYFSPSGDKKVAALRMGVLIEDLALLVTVPGSEQMRETIAHGLQDRLEVLMDKSPPLFVQPDAVTVDDYQRAERYIRRFMETVALLDLFQLGQYVERNILLSFEKKAPDKKKVEAFRIVAREHKLAGGIGTKLERLKVTDDPLESKALLLAVKEVIFAK